MKRFLFLSVSILLMSACFGQRNLLMLKKSTGTNFEYGKSATITTSDATVTNLDSLVIGSNEAGILEVQLVGFNDSTKTAVTGSKTLRYVKTGGTITLGTAADILASVTDATLSGATWAISAVNNDICIRVTGKASFNIRWVAVTRKIYRKT